MTMIQKHMLEEYQKVMGKRCVCRYTTAIDVIDVFKEANENHITAGKTCRDCWQIEAKGYEVDEEKWKEFVEMMLGSD